MSAAQVTGGGERVTALQSDEERRIKSYLTAQAAKLPPAAIVEKVEAAMAELRSAAAAIPPARFTQRPSADEWSADEVMAHVVASGAYFGGGIVSILDDRPPPARGEDDPGARPSARTAAAWCDQLAADRAALFARVLAADPQHAPDRSVEHGMFGALTWREALLFLRLHDLDHAGQLRKIAAALGSGDSALPRA
jgi:hypothetical protein